MELKDIETVLIEALQKPEDESCKGKYEESISAYLKEHKKSSDELITIIVKGMNIDRGANFLDFVAEVPKGDIQSLWKQVRENKEVVNNKDSNGLKLLLALLGLAIMQAGSIENQTGNIITKIVALVSDEKKPISERVYNPIVSDYFVEDVLKVKYPSWESLKLTGETNKIFAEILLKSIEGEQDEKYKSFRQWVVLGLKTAEQQIEKERIEAMIPKSRIDDLKGILDHYREVEKQLRDNVYEIARLEGVIVELQKEIKSLYGVKKSLESRIEDLQSNIEDQKKTLAKAEEEIDTRKTINDAFTAMKENDEKGILNDIAEDLKLTYKQMKGSESTEMNVELGEIYREMLKRIFKTLDKKGIRME